MTVTDTRDSHASATLSLTVSSRLPAQCVGQPSAQLSADGATVQVLASQVVSVSRDPSGHLTGMILQPPAPTVGVVLVVAPTGELPSGAIVVVDAVQANTDGTTSLQVQPHDAGRRLHAQGTVVTRATNAQNQPATATTMAAAQPRATPLGAPAFSCDGSVSFDPGSTTVETNLTPSIAALWKHPFFGGGGFYIGTGGFPALPVRPRRHHHRLAGRLHFRCGELHFHSALLPDRHSSR